MSTTADPSTRFILPEDAPYLKNMAALWAVDAKLARRIDALDDGLVYPVEPSRAGPPTVAVKTADGRSVYLHSRHQPIEEAHKLASGVKADGCMAYYLLGLGLGYHLELLFDRCGDDAVFCVMEPDLRLLRTTFQHRDLSRLLETGRILFFCDADKADIFERLTPRAALMTMGFEPLVHAPSMQIHPAFFQQMQGWLAEFAAFCRTSLQTLILNSQRTAENIARNVGWYAASPSLSRLHGRYRGKPAIIVSAGPSLRKNKHLLKDAAGHAVLIAVQTTLKPLLEMGIEPQFVTSLDYHDICTRFFENLPPTLSTELVAEPKATNRIFAMHPGPLSLLGNDFADGLLRELNLNKHRLSAGATVAHLAYYLAEDLGCNPIIFVGQDLGFSDGLCYTPGTSYEQVWRPELSRFGTLEMKQWEQIIRDRAILRKIPDQQGRPMYTEERLFTYLQQFERDFARAQATIIDASEGGAMKRGAQVMTLAEALAEHCCQPLPPAGQDHPGLNWNILPSCIDSLGRRRQEAVRIADIGHQTLPLLEEVRDHLEDQSRVNRTIARIDALRSEMDSLGRTYDLILQLTQLTELQRFQSDSRINAAKVQGIEKQRRQVTRDVENVRGIISAAGQFISLMDEVMAQLTLLAGQKGVTT